MQESTDREPAKEEHDSELDRVGAYADATSEATLSDIEESEAEVDSGSAQPDPPSPDGGLDGNDEIKDAGPM